MCIYCGTTHYRKIYESHNGPIGKDSLGRTHHIHHIDGNHANNDPTNLESLSIQEHYDKHYERGDWASCHRLAILMQHSPEEISVLASLNAKKQVETGKHPFVGGKVQRGTAHKRLESGNHLFLDSDWHLANTKKLVDNGTHNFLGPSMNQKMLAAGTHVSQNKEFQMRFAILQRDNSLAQVAAGTHPFLKLNAEQWTCGLCGRNGKGKSNFNRHYNSKTCKGLQEK